MSWYWDAPALFSPLPLSALRSLGRLSWRSTPLFIGVIVSELPTAWWSLSMLRRTAPSELSTWTEGAGFAWKLTVLATELYWIGC